MAVASTRAGIPQTLPVVHVSAMHIVRLADVGEELLAEAL
ncbi:hypothetical protein Vi05172_g7031 [Venturia inaequalis]|nr:hypothetical protein Vi05172_g7031 [Venturia inaequalis]